MKILGHFMKRYGLYIALICLVGLGAADVLTYTNLHLYTKAKRDVGNLTQKIRVLDRANSAAPFNDGVYHELGKAYFQLGMKNIGRPQQRDKYLLDSMNNLIISVRLNPGYYQTHFHLAQAMMYMNYFSSSEFDYVAEFKKAALLNNFDKEAYFEVGRILLSKWPELSEEDRAFCQTILKKITEDAGIAELRSIIQVWAAVVKDYKVMDDFLPQSARIYRMYADILGEISLDIEQRRLKMAEAERLEFSEANEAGNKAQAAMRTSHFSQAEDFYSTALANLENIRFYQSLVGLSVINSAELIDLTKSTRLGLLKAKIELKKSFAEIKDLFFEVVHELEGQDRLKNFEKFLLKNNIIEKRRVLDISDLKQTLCWLALDFARHRYQEIIRFGAQLKADLLFPDEGSNWEYARLFEILGDSYSKLDYIYDSGGFYLRALKNEPRNPDILSKILAHYERLNRVEAAAEILKRLNDLLTPREMDIKNPEILKGQLFQLPLRIEHESMELTIIFDGLKDGDPALISIFFNHPVIWEDYLSENSLTLNLTLNPGQNLLEIKPINRNIKITEVRWKPVSDSSLN